MLVAAVLGIVSTPVLWLLDGPDAGQLVGASVQAAAGVGALVWAWVQSASPSAAGARDAVVRTGQAEASGGVDGAYGNSAA
ncbi:hypothetical protein Stube_52270 [Streptomyces tubercidicus]|uniref:Uncharacterized protein n=1 Tax=Streptomyces tubercidicus TaxID=47759 RepID=A0A640UYW1_9ACTN|nr:hypothetical protein Stube_52270 [Streptomyces tubercidicus]